MIISRSVILTMRSVLNMIVEEIKTRVLYSWLLSDSRAFNEIVGKNMVDPVGHRWQ
jgi:hypothetical protein